MYKRLMIIVFFIIFTIGLSACSKNTIAKVAIKSVNSQTVLYGNYGYGEYYLSFANKQTLKVDQKVKITKGWTDNINLDQDNKVWIPIVNQEGTVPPDNRVIVVDLKNKTKKEIKVGVAPHYLYFKDNNVYVVCDEDGTNPTLYKINQQLKATKVKTMHEGGLIKSAAFDGESIYLLTNYIKNSEIYPMIDKVSLNGKVETKIITKQNIGNNGIKVMDDKIIVGLQSGSHATLGVFDKKNLQRLKNLPYGQDMVGQILSIKNHIIAVTNYSKLAQNGNKITFIDISQNKITKVISTQNDVESLSMIDSNRFVSTDNSKSTAEIFDENGKKLKYVNIPTQVFNIESIKR
jgi:hypothetical protein